MLEKSQYFKKTPAIKCLMLNEEEEDDPVSFYLSSLVDRAFSQEMEDQGTLGQEWPACTQVPQVARAASVWAHGRLGRGQAI